MVDEKCKTCSNFKNTIGMDFCGRINMCRSVSGIEPSGYIYEHYKPKEENEWVWPDYQKNFLTIAENMLTDEGIACMFTKISKEGIRVNFSDFPEINVEFYLREMEKVDCFVSRVKSLYELNKPRAEISEVQSEFDKSNSAIHKINSARTDKTLTWLDYKDIPDKKEGTKFDEGKVRVGEMVIDFMKPLLQVCKVWEFGANKYAKSNWKKVENGADRYTNAMIRHLIHEDTEVYDQETKLHHAVHVAWNGLARLYFIVKDGE